MFLHPVETVGYRYFLVLLISCETTNVILFLWILKSSCPSIYPHSHEILFKLQLAEKVMGELRREQNQSLISVSRDAPSHGRVDFPAISSQNAILW